MQELLWVGVGGFAGAVHRYLVGRSVAEWTRQTGFPVGTLAVNVVGCLLIGLLSHLVDARGLFSGETRAFVFVGTLGAFTTFSTFSNETTVFFPAGATIDGIAQRGHTVDPGTAFRPGRSQPDPVDLVVQQTSETIAGEKDGL